MATYQFGVIGPNTLPDSSGNVFFEPYIVKATNDFWKHGNFVFNDTSTDDKIYGVFQIPQNYVGTAKIVIVWTTTATTGNANWEFAYRAVGGNDAESLDQATAQETVTSGATAAPTATNNRMATSVDLTGSNFAVADTVEFYIARKGTSLDTIAAALSLFELRFQYTDA